MDALPKHAEFIVLIGEFESIGNCTQVAGSRCTSDSARKVAGPPQQIEPASRPFGIAGAGRPPFVLIPLTSAGS
jgi:hypothetical protein